MKGEKKNKSVNYTLIDRKDKKKNQIERKMNKKLLINLKIFIST